MMHVIRCFEEHVEALFTTGVIRGTTHPCTGQEAAAVGTCLALSPGDRVCSTHRGHGHFLALGGDPRRIMAELFGKVDGYSRGRGGSQLMADYSLGFLGSNGITGGGIPFAAGVALAMRQSGARHVVISFFGDGAANQGTFHETLNMAALWALPVLFICENNRYAMSTPVEESTAVPALAARASVYGMPGLAVDGNDLDAVFTAARQAVQRARDGQGPTLLEARTYRLSGHSRGDPRKYRSAGEEAFWKARDPIVRLEETLRKNDILDDAAAAAMRREARRIVDDAERFARESPDPDPATVNEGVYA